MHTEPKPFAFVLMPFSKEFDDAYELAIKPACELAGAYAERVDKQIFTGSILERVFNQISKADIIVADMSERNPNVFYEVGYAHALGKQTILLTRSANDIPFDLKHYPHIVYNDRLTDLKRDLETRVQWHIANPNKANEDTNPLVLRINDILLNGNTEIAVTALEKEIFLNLDVQNKISRRISLAKFQIGLFAPINFYYIGNLEYKEYANVLANDNRHLFMFKGQFSIWPDAWDSFRFELKLKYKKFGEGYNFIIRLYCESGPIDYPFTVTIEA